MDGLIDEGQDPWNATAGLRITDATARRYAEGLDGSAVDLRLADVARRLELDAVDTAILGLAAAAELDPRYGRVFAFLHDDVTRRRPSVRLIADVLDGSGMSRPSVLERLDVDSRLRRIGCLWLADADAQRAVLERAVEVASPVVARLLGSTLTDEHLSPVRTRFEAGEPLGRHDVIARLRRLAGDERWTVAVSGPDAGRLLATALGCPLIVVGAAELLATESRRRVRILAALEGALLAFSGVEELEVAQRRLLAEGLRASPSPRLLIVEQARAVLDLGSDVLHVAAPVPELAERRAAWRAYTSDADVEDVANKFRLSLEQIETAAAFASSRGEEGAISGAALDAGARHASASKVGELAQRLQAVHGWDSLVLPERQRDALRSISAYLRHRDLVLAEWGYERAVARNHGLKILFAGESGTGKTMSAQVLAAELGLDIFRVDLATIVSKYIGETEKNLDRIFAAAEGSNAILFFDEADALFGKRSEISDSHDRYANIEVAYLLQKMESYAGAVILATNFRRNIDDAFARRLDFVIDFPFPEPQDRLRIWQRLLPAEAPVAEDIDLTFLAQQFKLSGGSIRNCSLSAAFQAADEGGVIEMRHLVRAVAQEYVKHGRLTLEADFERFHGQLG